MKTFRLLWFPLALIALCAGFVSCSDDDDDYSSSDLVGTWQVIRSQGFNSFIVDGKEERDDFDEKYPEDADEEDAYVGSYAQWKDNGEYYSGDKLQALEYVGDWSIKGDKLKIIYAEDNEEAERKILKMTATELIIEAHFKDRETYDGKEYIYEYYEKTTLQKMK